MKSTIKYLALIGFFLVTLGSCKKGDEYYLSPNSPSEANLPTLLSAVEVGTMNSFEGDLARTTSILVQHHVGAQSQSESAQFYNLIEDQFNNQWAQLYQTLENAKQLTEMASTNNPYYGGIGRVLTAMNLGLLTDLWDEIPYSEALLIKDKVLSPKFDKQEVVLGGIINTLDEAILNLSQASSSNLALPGADDLIFGGDVNLWLKTAYTLKARYLNRYSNKGSYDPVAILASLSQGISDNAENCMAVHGAGNASNQWYAFENTRGYIVSAQPIIDSLLLRPADSRIGYYFSSNDTGAYVGSPLDITNDNEFISRFGTYLAGSESTPFPLVTFAEAKFIEAEVLARTMAPTASDALNDAIKASCQAVSGGAFSGDTLATYTASNTDVSRVMYEKWLAMFGQVEAYNDYRRTGYPNLTPNPAGNIPTIPARMPVPQQERVNNSNAPIKPITEKVWWAQ